MSTITKDLGVVTAYGYYKAGGGTMTEAEFTQFMVDFGTASKTAVDAASAALESERAAKNSEETATRKASEAGESASTASTKAGEAAQSASDADTAKTDAVAAKTAAETAQGKAEDAQAAAEAVAESIPSDYSQLSADVSDVKEDLSSIESVLEMSESAYTFVDSIEEMTDHTKSYVLRSNNHIYTAQEVQGDPPDEFGIGGINVRMVNGNDSLTQNGFFKTALIPFTQDDVYATITIKNAGYLKARYGSYNYGSCRMQVYDSSRARLGDVFVLGGRVYGAYVPLISDDVDLSGSISSNSRVLETFQSLGDDVSYIAFCYPLTSESNQTVADDALSAISQAEIEAKGFEIYVSTHHTIAHQFVDTGRIYTQQSAIQRIDSELSEKLDANQGSENVGKVLMIGADGAVEPTDIVEPTGDYKINLVVGAWNSDGKTPTSDGNQLRNSAKIPLSEVSKIKFVIPDNLSAISGHGFLLDESESVVGVVPWGGYLDFSAIPVDAVFANISITAKDTSGTSINVISPYLDDISNALVTFPTVGADMIKSIRNKIGGSVMCNDYIKEEVSRVITELQAVQLAHPEALTIGFMTDLHFRRDMYDVLVNLIDDMSAVQMISQDCLVGGLMMGGDNIAETSTRANQLLSLKAYGNKIRQIGLPVYSTKGNHDDSSISGWDSSVSKYRIGYNIFDPEYYLHTEKVLENNPFVVFPSNPTGLYYYVDFPAERIRLIVLNSVDIPYVEDPDNAGYLMYGGQANYGYSNAQLNWVAHTALDFSDKKDADEWGVVTMQHVNDNPNISAFSTAVVRNNGAQMYNIFKAFKARTTYSSASSDTYFPHDVSVDFTNAAQELIARISGHTHADRYVLSDDGLHISTMQAGPNSVGNSPASDGVTYTKTAGTGKESAVDFFTFDRIGKKVYCTRYGAGLSRELSWV